MTYCMYFGLIDCLPFTLYIGLGPCMISHCCMVDHNVCELFISFMTSEMFQKSRYSYTRTKSSSQGIQYLFFIGLLSSKAEGLHVKRCLKKVQEGNMILPRWSFYMRPCPNADKTLAGNQKFSVNFMYIYVSWCFTEHDLCHDKQPSLKLCSWQAMSSIRSLHGGTACI